MTDWEQRQLDIDSGLRMDRMAHQHTDPQTRRLTREQIRAGAWECKACECYNGEDDDKCWNCEHGRDE